MAVAIFCGGVVIHEVVTRHHAPGEFAVIAINSGVNHRDGDVLTGDTAEAVSPRPNFWGIDIVEAPEVASQLWFV